uniref:Uncharacterized protein n=1 Tax=Oryza meridionalis TaxID=40149 RepID=A0A0E0DG99_9ORYZ
MAVVISGQGVSTAGPDVGVSSGMASVNVKDGQGPELLRMWLILVFLLCKVDLKALVLVFLISEHGLKALTLVFLLCEHGLKVPNFVLLLHKCGLKVLVLVFLLCKHGLKEPVLIFLLRKVGLKALDFAAPSVDPLCCLLRHLCQL